MIRHKSKCALLSPQKTAKQWKKDNDGNYQCEKCKKSFPYRTSISRHVDKCEPSKSSRVKENKCIFCDRIFPYPSDLKRHLKVHEKKGEMMVPSFIPSASASASSLFDDTEELPSMDDTMVSDTTLGSSFISTSSNDVSMFSDTGPSSLDLSIESRQVEEVVILNSTVIPEDNPEDSFDDTPGKTTEPVRLQEDTTEDFPENVSEVAPLYQCPPSAEVDTDQHINDVAPNTVIDGSRKWKDILTYTDATSVREADIYQCLIQHLKSLLHSGKGRHQFNLLLYNMFGPDRLQDSAFLYFLSSQLSTNYSNFKKSVETWFDGGMKSKRGRWTLSPEIRQAVYDTWIDHTVASTDNRNNRATVQISKMEYLQRYHGIENKTVQVEEKKNKRGRVNMSGNRMIMAETVRSMQKSLLGKGIFVSIGSVLNLHPFFVTNASEKEMSLCLCKLCLNTKFFFML